MPDFPNTVAAYADECDLVYSWLSTDKWLDQHEFDRLSREYRRANPRHAFKLHKYTGDTYLPPVFGGDLNLTVLRGLQVAGMVEGREENGLISYRLSEQLAEPATT